MSSSNTYATDWNNVDLKSQSYLTMLDPYSFDTLLLEVSCNLPVINRETVKAQALESIKSKYNEALSILESNLDNIVKEALEYRNQI